MSKKIFVLAIFVLVVIIGILFLILQRSKEQPPIIPPPSQENINTTSANINIAPEVLLEDNLNEALGAIDAIQDLEVQE